MAADRGTGSRDGPGVAARAGRGRVVLHRDAAPSRLRHGCLGKARNLGGAVALGSPGPAPRRDARRTRRPARPSSLARDAGDELSDIDAGLGVADAHWPAAVATVRQIIGRAGQVADEFQQPFSGKNGQDAKHLFTLYASGLQLSLVVMPASWRAGLPPQAVALYDADGQLARPYLPAAARVTAETAREWPSLAWLAPGDLAKYLDRGSVWEARSKIEEARDHAWKLWATGIGASYPVFGLTSVLDTPGYAIPPGIETTAPGLDPAMADVLDQVVPRAQDAVPFDPPAGLGARQARPAGAG